MASVTNQRLCCFSADGECGSVVGPLELPRAFELGSQMKSVLLSKSIVMKSLASSGLVELVKYMNSIRETDSYVSIGRCNL